MDGQFVNDHPAYILDHENENVGSVSYLSDPWWQKPTMQLPKAVGNIFNKLSHC